MSRRKGTGRFSHFQCEKRRRLCQIIRTPGCGPLRGSGFHKNKYGRHAIFRGQACFRLINGTLLVSDKGDASRGRRQDRALKPAGRENGWFSRGRRTRGNMNGRFSSGGATAGLVFPPLTGDAESGLQASGGRRKQSDAVRTGISRFFFNYLWPVCVQSITVGLARVIFNTCVASRQAAFETTASLVSGIDFRF